MEPTRLRLGVLDSGFVGKHTGPRERLLHTLSFASRLDAAGFHRFWITEHHGGQAVQGCPETLLPLVADRTRRILVGTGAIVLPFYAPLKVVQTALAAEALFPGRTELGVARGPGADQECIAKLTASEVVPVACVDPFKEKLRELVGYARGDRPSSLRIVPEGVPAPPLWVMGASPSAARLAGEVGTGFALGAFLFKRDDAEPKIAEALEAYRAAAAANGHTPRVVLAVSCLVLDTDEAARAIDARGLWDPHIIVGSPSTARAQTEALAKRHGVEDIVFQTSPLPMPETHCRAFEALGRAFGLPGAPLLLARR